MQIKVGNLARAGWPAAKIAAHLGINQMQVIHALEAMDVRIVRARVGTCNKGHPKYVGEVRCRECQARSRKKAAHAAKAGSDQ